ncbi:hypothetical protein RCL_jg18337.t1 [Rhizophagus clarus]|uniref:Uncharacterized protein n=1 Tax=Rhizophagus clarus TaxID=94130 RepID=A0A8H3QNR0_9GLOM|nr:hypothetical protein RCL_jg18337.t1 [Rhizophagus clarus]
MSHKYKFLKSCSFKITATLTDDLFFIFNAHFANELLLQISPLFSGLQLNRPLEYAFLYLVSKIPMKKSIRYENGIYFAGEWRWQLLFRYLIRFKADELFSKAFETLEREFLKLKINKVFEF